MSTNGSNKLPTISEDTTTLLQNARQADKDLFHSYVNTLLKAGWPLRSIAEPMKVSNTTVSVWASKGTTLDSPAEALPTNLPKALNSRYRHADISKEQTQTLQELMVFARKVRHHTPPNSPYRVASQQLDTLLKEMNSNGVSIERLALECGVSRGAIVRRLKKD